MAKNSMTPEQDLITREFFSNVSNDTKLFPQDPVGQRNMNNIILRLLNYDYVGGCYIEAGQNLTRSIGGTPDVKCEWNEDTERAKLNSGAYIYEDSSSGEDEADSSESSEDTEVREAILREDV